MPDNLDNIIFLKFEDSKIPTFKEQKKDGYIKFGDNDDYPDYLLLLLNKSPKHNAIINGKVNYIFGSGLHSMSENEKLKAWIEKCNRADEGMQEICKKSIADTEAFAGYYWHIIPNRMGEIAEIYHIDFRKVRSNKDRSEFFYKNDWQDKREEVKIFPKFSKGLTVESIFAYREYRQGLGTYPLPSYIASINYIEADFEVSKHTLANAKNGFAASKMINFFNGEPEDEQKKKQIERRVNAKFTGSEGSKVMITFNNDVTKAPQVQDLGSSDLTKEDFSAVDNLITQNIYAGHQITSPMLFGIQEQGGKLGGVGNELKFSYDIFKNTYVNAKQKQIEDVLNYFGNIMGLGSDLKLQDVDPIGIPFTDQTIVQVAPVEWIWEKLGIDPAKYPNAQPAITPTGAGVSPAKIGVPGDSIDVAQAVNDNIKNLSAKQHQQLMRIIRQFSKGQLNQAQASALLKSGLGLNDQEIGSLLGVDGFDKDYTEEEVAMLFSEVGDDINKYEIIKTKSAKFSEEEFTMNEVFDAATETATAGSIRKGVGDIAKVASEISIKYSYGLRDIASGPVLIPTSRPFCVRMVELSKVRLFSRKEINDISERVGYSVWNRAGGFWNNHGTVETQCRHEWKSHIVIKKK
jgi:hypothetical protein